MTKTYRTISFLLSLIFIATTAMAQSSSQSGLHVPDYELFTGGSYVRANFPIRHVDLIGWNASVTQNRNHWFGLKADFSGHYGRRYERSSSLHSFTFGPQLTSRYNDKANPFFHALFGAVRYNEVVREDPDFSDPDIDPSVPVYRSRSKAGFGMNLGTGLDLKLSDRLALRVFQLDYMLGRVADKNRDTLRASAGLVFRFGKR